MGFLFIFSSLGRNAHHKAFITHNFGLSDSAKLKAKSGDFFFQNDTGDNYTVVSVADAPAPNDDASGFAGRIHWITKNKVRFNIPLTWDLQSVRYITPGHDIKLIMTKNRESIPLLARESNLRPKIRFRDLKLLVGRFRLVQPGPEVINWYIKRGPQYYGINRVEMRKRNLTPGVLNVTVPSLCFNQLPWHLLCSLSHRDQNFDINKDPFCYQTHHLKEFQWIKNSLPYPNKPLIVDDENIDSEGKITTFKNFQENMGFTWRHADTGPSMTEYFSNQFMMVWNTTMCKCVGGEQDKYLN